MVRRKLSLVLGMILVLFLVLPVWGEAFSGIGGCFRGKVVAVLDGDTLEVMHQGRAERVRLRGIDCPEKGQAFGRRARQFTAGLVMGQEVTVETAGRDRYGRTLGTVILPDGRNLSHALVRAGLAWRHRYYSLDGSLGQMEAEARAARRGLWRDPHPVAPGEFRRNRRAR
jgi:endonuclease YncB( thermonuclease family)